MDIKINNSDISLDLQGEYEFISGIDEVVQKLLICSKIHKGSFIYNKELGTRLRDIDPNSKIRVLTATAILNEALIDVKGARAEVVSFDKTNSGIAMMFKVRFRGEERNVEVILSENL